MSRPGYPPPGAAEWMREHLMRCIERMRVLRDEERHRYRESRGRLHHFAGFLEASIGLTREQSELLVETLGPTREEDLLLADARDGRTYCVAAGVELLAAAEQAELAAREAKR